MLLGGEHFWPHEKIQGENCDPEYVLRSFFGDEPLGFYGSTVPFPKEAVSVLHAIIPSSIYSDHLELSVLCN